MKKIVLMCLLTTFLFAQNPNVYSALGDVIYDNVNNIEKLKKIPEYKKYSTKIDKYIIDVENLKKVGFKIQGGDEKYNKIEYLQNLRELSKLNDFFLRSVKANYTKSISDENSILFSKMINSGLINIKENKEQIKAYYLSHSDVNTTGVIQNLMDEEVIKKQKKRSKIKRLTKKQLQEAKIRRIRENDRIKQENIKKALEDEAIKKKIKIREKQKKDLVK